MGTVHKKVRIKSRFCYIHADIAIMEASPWENVPDMECGLALIMRKAFLTFTRDNGNRIIPMGREFIW